MKNKSGRFIYISIGTEFLIATAKFGAAIFTGSTTMLAEGIHSVIDFINQVLLLFGIKKSKKKPDQERPFGYGRELYFWSFIVALMMFSLGGCISFYEGIRRIRNPSRLENATWNYVVLAISFVFTIISMLPALKKFNKQRGNLNFWAAIIKTKDPSVLIVLLGDIGDIVCLGIAFAALLLSHYLTFPYFDGIATLMIGLILISISIVLVIESRSLLMGETASKKTLSKIVRLVESDKTVVKNKQQFSVYLSPDEVVLQLMTVFKNELDTKDINEAIQRIIKDIQREFPQIKQIFIEPVGS